MNRSAQVKGLHARTPIHVAGERLLLARAADLRAAEARAARRLDVRTVHDLRVACRRLRVAVKVFGKKSLRSLDARLEQLQDALGAVRDLQLEARWLARHRADAATVTARLRSAEARLRRVLEQWGRRSEPALVRALSQVRRRGTLGGRRMRKRLRKRVGELEAALWHRDPLDPETAHGIRIAAKKLRYEAELLRAAFELDGAIDALTELQGALGNVHDADLRLRALDAEPRLARAARAERDRSASRARRIIGRARKLWARLRRRQL